MATTASKNTLLIFAIVVLLFSLFGLAGESHWTLDLFGHFKVQYILAALTIFSLNLILNRKDHVLSGVTLATVVINLLYVSPTLFNNVSQANGLSTLKVISINLNLNNRNYEAVEKYIQDESPDFIVLLELTPQWGKQLKSLEVQFPFAYAVMRSDNFGIGILSKQALVGHEIHYEESMNIPFLVVNISQEFNIIAAHPFPPLGAKGTESRNRYLEKLASFVRQSKKTTVLCGDLNSTPWTATFRKFLLNAGLKSYQSGLFSTWPTQLLPLSIPIDHCLVSNDIQVVSYKKGPSVGSDHYPIQIEFIKIDRRNISSE